VERDYLIWCSDCATDLTSEELWFVSRVGQSFRPAMIPTQLPIRWVPWDVSHEHGTGYSFSSNAEIKNTTS
jgi:hypothetical protein